MSYRVVAFDLDGTLLGSNREIRADSVRAIQTLRDQGVKVVLVTGRHHVAVRAYHHQLQLDTPVICCNGTYLYDFINDRVIQGAPIAQSDALQIVQAMDYDEINMLMYVSDAMTYEHLDDHLIEMQQWAETVAPELRPVMRQVDFKQVIESGDTIWKFVASGADPAQIQQAVAQLQTQLDLSCEWSWYNRVDLSAPGNTKGFRLEQLLKDWQIDPKHVIAFGDNGNDVSMIKLAGQGVAMGNAVDELKQAADWVTAGNNDNGIAAALEHFFPEFFE
ncbi:pyridoxal phosphatase [Celerinatantimonas sp. YJH-8]|uniref:pyridoxal phosphatase n=1 Tax=Celerinatantimonas sp. YJH-8 TaxID=3228714 RepID=UPI0038C7BC68